MQDPLLGGLVERADGGDHRCRPIALEASLGNAVGALHERLRLALGALVDRLAADCLTVALERLGRAGALPGASLSCHG